MRLSGNDNFGHWVEAIRTHLETDAVRRCATALSTHQRPDGGFAGRSKSSDLYYTFFATASLALLGQPVKQEALGPYLETFGDGTDLDLVHACCLLRCRDLMRLMHTPEFMQRRLVQSRLAERLARAGQQPLTHHISQCLDRSEDLYDWYLGLSSLGAEPDRARIRDLLEGCRCPDNGYGAPGSTTGTTTVTAAALSLGHAVGLHDDKAIEWLLAQKCDGSGFRANPGVPIPDLLSTAAAVNTLAYVGYDWSPLAMDILTTTETCWGPGGQFVASPCEPTEDPEYTFYGLLTLSHLLA